MCRWLPGCTPIHPAAATRKAVLQSGGGAGRLPHCLVVGVALAVPPLSPRRSSRRAGEPRPYTPRYIPGWSWCRARSPLRLAACSSWHSESPMPLAHRRTAWLRRGRISTPGAAYFTTLRTRGRAPIFNFPGNAIRVIQAFDRLQMDCDASIYGATVMPDHIHLLFVLGERLSVGQVHAKIKTLACDYGRANWRWQSEAFEHRLRSSENIEDYGFYIFMNPDQAGCCLLSQSWPWWYCPDPTTFRFLQGLKADGTPPPEWVDEIKMKAAQITKGE